MVLPETFGTCVDYVEENQEIPRITSDAKNDEYIEKDEVQKMDDEEGKPSNGKYCLTGND